MIFEISFKIAEIEARNLYKISDSQHASLLELMTVKPRFFLPKFLEKNTFFRKTQIFIFSEKTHFFYFSEKTHFFHFSKNQGIPKNQSYNLEKDSLRDNEPRKACGEAEN